MMEDSKGVKVSGDERWAVVLQGVGRVLLRIPRAWAWIPPLAWVGLIFALSSMQAPFSGLPGSTFMSFLGNGVHAFEFGVLLLLLIPLLPRAKAWVVWSRASAAVLIAAAFLFAVGDEIHQSQVPGRDASLLDLCTDLAGILSVYWVVRRLEVPAKEAHGLLALLGKALLVCALCAGLATLWGVFWNEGPWPFPS